MALVLLLATKTTLTMILYFSSSAGRPETYTSIRKGQFGVLLPYTDNKKSDSRFEQLKILKNETKSAGTTNKIVRLAPKAE